ncbi:hypothetical protein PTKIN_Ptkin12aG0013900 [Pterospermum kingtungense]
MAGFSPSSQLNRSSKEVESSANGKFHGTPILVSETHPVIIWRVVGMEGLAAGVFTKRICLAQKRKLDVHGPLDGNGLVEDAVDCPLGDVSSLVDVPVFLQGCMVPRSTLGGVDQCGDFNSFIVSSESSSGRMLRKKQSGLGRGVVRGGNTLKLVTWHKGGLALLWNNENVVNLKPMCSDRIDVGWLMVILRQVLVVSDMEDFNELLSNEKKLSGGLQPEWQVHNFREVEVDCEFQEFSVQGHIFTWSTVRCLKFVQQRVKGVKPFQFEDFWLKKEDCKLVIGEVWSSCPSSDLV